MVQRYDFFYENANLINPNANVNVTPNANANENLLAIFGKPVLLFY